MQVHLYLCISATRETSIGLKFITLLLSLNCGLGDLSDNLLLHVMVINDCQVVTFMLQWWCAFEHDGVGNGCLITTVSCHHPPTPPLELIRKLLF